MNSSFFFFSKIFSCATDKTVGVWDVTTGTRIKKFKGHTSFVNSVSSARRGNEILVSGSDDGTIKVNIVDIEEIQGLLSNKTINIKYFELLDMGPSTKRCC